MDVDDREDSNHDDDTEDDDVAESGLNEDSSEEEQIAEELDVEDELPDYEETVKSRSQQEAEEFDEEEELPEYSDDTEPDEPEPKKRKPQSEDPSPADRRSESVSGSTETTRRVVFVLDDSRSALLEYTVSPSDPPNWTALGLDADDMSPPEAEPAAESAGPRRIPKKAAPATAALIKSSPSPSPSPSAAPPGDPRPQRKRTSTARRNEEFDETYEAKDPEPSPPPVASDAEGSDSEFADDGSGSGSKRMTARQRALQGSTVSGFEEELMSLPMNIKADKQLTEAQLKKKAQLAEKRRIDSELRIEEEKKSTILRLLESKKSTKKALGPKEEAQHKKVEKRPTAIRYGTKVIPIFTDTPSPSSSVSGADRSQSVGGVNRSVPADPSEPGRPSTYVASVSFPAGDVSLELTFNSFNKHPTVPPTVKCSNTACSEPKRYLAALLHGTGAGSGAGTLTRVPVCSLDCLKAIKV